MRMLNRLFRKKPVVQLKEKLRTRTNRHLETINQPQIAGTVEEYIAANEHDAADLSGGMAAASAFLGGISLVLAVIVAENIEIWVLTYLVYLAITLCLITFLASFWNYKFQAPKRAAIAIYQYRLSVQAPTYVVPATDRSLVGGRILLGGAMLVAAYFVGSRWKRNSP